MFCAGPLRSTALLPRLRNLDRGGFLRRVRMIRTGVRLQLAVHRLAQLRLGEHPAYGVLDNALGMPLADDPHPRFAQAALVAAVLAIDLLVFLTARELHRRGVDDDDMITGVDERRVRRLVLALEETCRSGRNAAEHLPVGVDEMPGRARRGAGYERRHFPKIPSPIANLCVGGDSERNRA